MSEWIHQHPVPLLLLVLLLALSALTTTARTAFAAVNRRLLRRDAEDTQAIDQILRHPLRVHACLSLLDFALYAGIATLCIALVDERFTWLMLPLAFLLVLVVGEITPRAIAIRHAQWWALQLASPAKGAVRLLNPWMALVQGLLRWVLKRTNRTSLESLSHLGPGEIRALLEESEAVGIANPLEREMVERLLSLNSIEAWEVMLPREKLLAIPDTGTLEEAFRQAAAWKISRLPVYGRDLDDLWGYVTVTRKARWSGTPAMAQPLSTWREQLDNTTACPLSPLIREPEETKIERLLHQMRLASARVVVLTAAGNRTSGMLSFENLISAVVGEIASVRAGGDGVIWLADRVLFEGWVTLEHARDVLGLPSQGEAPATLLAGWLAERLGRAPLPGDRLELEGHEFIIRQSGYGQGVAVLVRALRHPEGEPPGEAAS